MQQKRRHCIECNGKIDWEKKSEKWKSKRKRKKLCEDNEMLFFNVKLQTHTHKEKSRKEESSMC